MTSTDAIPSRRRCTLVATLLLVVAVAAGCGSSSGPKGSSTASAGAPLSIAYSDWPGWVAWEIGIQKRWFEEEGVEVEFKWFEYVPSIEAFSAGQVDAVTMTNGDMLMAGAAGAPSVAVLINDYSNGNDMVVGAPGIGHMADLRGKKVGVEVGYVGHLLLLRALASAQMTVDDVELVDVRTEQAPQLLARGDVAAIVAWQPNSGQALEMVPGSTAIFTSADAQGLIYDLLCVSPRSLGERRADWLRVAKVWFRIADHLSNPANLDEAAQLMGARVGLSAARYRPLLGGTRILDLADNRARFVEAPGLGSLHGSTEVVGEFQVAHGVYSSPQPVAPYLDGSLVQQLPGPR